MNYSLTFYSKTRDNYPAHRKSATARQCGPDIPVIALLTLLIAVMLSGCGGFNQKPHTPPPASVSNPPIYPGAQNTNIEPEGSHEPRFEERITFEVNDEGDKVLEYYEGILKADGWELVHLETQPPNAISFQQGGKPLYRFGVKADQTSASNTSVVLTVQTITAPD
jgi:hypothetical protein